MKKYLDVTFMFQGSEPMLIGLPFYEEFIKLVQKYNVSSVSTNFAIQTNGTLITDESSAFFKHNNFLVGISIDDPKKYHDTFRVMANNNNSFDEVLSGLELLKKYKVDYNI